MMPVIIDTRVPRHTGLNRTFYGIERPEKMMPSSLIWVLIVPFMELKVGFPVPQLFIIVS